MDSEALMRRGRNQTVKRVLGIGATSKDNVFFSVLVENGFCGGSTRTSGTTALDLVGTP